MTLNTLKKIDNLHLFHDLLTINIILLSCLTLLFPLQWDGEVRMWEHRQTHPLEEERERGRDAPMAGDKV